MAYFHHEVTIGKSYGGKNPETQKLGDCLYFCASGEIFGQVNIGNHVAIGANCVVTEDVPDNGLVVGVPGKVISFNGSANYVVNTIDGSET